MKFDIATVLTVYTGRLVTNIENLYEILSFMSGVSVFTHQIPKFIKICKVELANQFPELYKVSVEEFDDLFAQGLNPDQAVAKWLVLQNQKIGSRFDIKACPEKFADNDMLKDLEEMFSQKAT